MIRSKFFTAAASLALVSAVLFSAENFAREGEGGRHVRSHDDALMSLLERLDSNADGVLSQGEFSVRTAQGAERRFDRMDADADAVLSFDEFSSVRNHRTRPDLDTLDIDALELCVAETLGYELPERPDPESSFAEVDANSDGSIDLEESLAAADLRAEDRFVEIDADGDGQLVSDEIGSYQLHRHEQKQAHHSCVKDQFDEESLLN